MDVIKLEKKIKEQEAKLDLANKQIQQLDIMIIRKKEEANQIVGAIKQLSILINEEKKELVESKKDKDKKVIDAEDYGKEK